VNTLPKRRITVAAAVIVDAQGRFLLAQRPPSKPYPGYWEFPGGKIEPGESPRAALVRELAEELGIQATVVHPWLTLDYDYSHAAVRLHFHFVLAWSGDLYGREGQALAWQTVSDITVAPMLPANTPVLRTLSLPAVYGISCAGELGQEVFMERLTAALDNGLRLIQVREKQMSPPQLLEFTHAVVSQARPYGARVVVNGPADLAQRAGADGVHLTAAQLATTSVRPLCDWCGASCHTEEDLDRARDLQMDFVVLGPVKPTASHPGMAGLGWPQFAEWIKDYPLPVYAIGGMQSADLETAWTHGAHGIAMIRGAWSAGVAL
jgi:8-oxo-dGTP diphosphatase